MPRWMLDRAVILAVGKFSVGRSGVSLLTEKHAGLNTRMRDDLPFASNDTFLDMRRVAATTYRYSWCFQITKFFSHNFSLRGSNVCRSHQMRRHHPSVEHLNTYNFELEATYAAVKNCRCRCGLKRKRFQSW